MVNLNRLIQECFTGTFKKFFSSISRHFSVHIEKQHLFFLIISFKSIWPFLISKSCRNTSALGGPHTLLFVSIIVKKNDHLSKNAVYIIVAFMKQLYKQMNIE